MKCPNSGNRANTPLTTPFGGPSVQKNWHPRGLSPRGCHYTPQMPLRSISRSPVETAETPDKALTSSEGMSLTSHRRPPFVIISDRELPPESRTTQGKLVVGVIGAKRVRTVPDPSRKRAEIEKNRGVARASWEPAPSPFGLPGSLPKHNGQLRLEALF